MVYRRYKKIYRRRRAPLAKRMANIAKKVYDKNTENKRFITNTTDAAGGNAPSGGNLISLNQGIGNGSLNGQRIGNKIKITSVRFNGSFTYADAYNNVRMMIMWSKAQPDLTRMPSLTSPYDYSLQPGKILYDKTVTLENLASSGILNVPLGRTIWRRINGFSTYNGSGTSPVGGFLSLYLVSDSLATQHPSFVGTFIVNYQDA